MSDVRYARRRVVYPDDKWAWVSVVHLPAESLSFADLPAIETGHERRIDIARLRRLKAKARGEDEPVIVWELPRDEPVAARFPCLNAMTVEGEYLLSANSFVTYTLRRLLDGRLWNPLAIASWVPSAEDPAPQETQAVLEWLRRNDLLLIEPMEGATNAENAHLSPGSLIPLGGCHFVRDYARVASAAVVFNTAYFLLEQDDLISHHSALGSAHGLLIENGVVRRPPLYCRAAIYFADRQWQVARFGMDDILLRLQDGTLWRAGKDCHVNPTTDVEIAIYTRLYGIGTEGFPAGKTPPAHDRIEFTVVDRQVVGWKPGGAVLIPQNGFVLSIRAGALSQRVLDTFRADATVSYELLTTHPVERAVQAGPLLIENGGIALHPGIFAEEEFVPSRELDAHRLIGCSPTDYCCEIDHTRAARIGLGIKFNGDVVVVAVDSVNVGMETDEDSAGATLWELAEQLQLEGAVNAINLDGGGSMQIFIYEGLLTRPADRRGHRHLLFERMIPSVGIFQ